MQRGENLIVKKLTFAETLASRNPQGSNDLLVKNGYPASGDVNTLAKRINLFLANGKEQALQALTEIHPDRELLFSYFEGSQQPAPKINISMTKKSQVNRFKGTKHHNCCGHADGEGSNDSNVDGFGENTNVDGDDNFEGYEFSNCAGNNMCAGCRSKQLNRGRKYSNAAGDNKGPVMLNNTTLAIVGIIALTAVVLIAFDRKKA